MVRTLGQDSRLGLDTSARGGFSFGPDSKPAVESAPSTGLSERPRLGLEASIRRPHSKPRHCGNNSRPGFKARTRNQCSRSRLKTRKTKNAIEQRTLTSGDTSESATANGSDRPSARSRAAELAGRWACALAVVINFKRCKGRMSDGVKLGRNDQKSRSTTYLAGGKRGRPDRWRCARVWCWLG